MLALCASIVVVLVDGFTYNTIAPISDYPLTSWSTFPLFLGNAAFLYLIHSVILPTEQSMLQREVIFSPPVLFSHSYSAISTGCGCFDRTGHRGKRCLCSARVFSVIDLFCWMISCSVNNSYGLNTQGNVIDNLHAGALKTVVKIMLTVDLVGSSVLFLFPVFELFERAIWAPGQLVLIRVQILRNVLRTAIGECERALIFVLI